METGEVDEDGHRGATFADGLFEALELTPDVRQVAQDLGQAHHRHLLGTDDAFQTSGFHARSAHSKDGRGLAGVLQLLAQSSDQQRAVVLAAGLACRDKDAGSHVLPITPPVAAHDPIIAA